ncbi:hypothetical protein E4U53_001502 [Claviceps sorghi]|nr:hypothetical protein E4U53_001502 [Claviceps sorghi]
MVVGAGETGADVAHLAVTTPGVDTVLLCHRDGVHFAPKRNPGPVVLPALRRPDPAEPGIPVDVSRASMFDTAYVHPLLRRHDALLWAYYRWYIKCLLFISSGTTLGMDQWIGGISADVRHIWKRDDPSVAFIGFVRPSLGAIPPLAELQAQLWTTHLLAPHRITRPLRPDDQTHYMLRPGPGARITYGVDHESYAYQLALDMDAAPGLRDILGLCSWTRPVPSCRLFLVWVFGANFNVKFRLRGP